MPPFVRPSCERARQAVRQRCSLPRSRRLPLRSWSSSLSFVAARSRRRLQRAESGRARHVGALSRLLPAWLKRALEMSNEGRSESGTGEEIVVRAFECVLDQVLRSLRVDDPSVELHDLGLGQLTPGSTSAARGPEQPTDLRKREAGVLVEADERD